MTEATRKSIIEMEAQLNENFVERSNAIRAISISLLTGSNYILVGDPGTGKTKLAKLAASHVTGAKMFAPSTLGAYTTMTDLVGEKDYSGLKTGKGCPRITDGKLAGTDLAFLDELFKASDSTCSALLSLFNRGERTFEGRTTDLWSAGSATNWPEVNAMKQFVHAFWDRLDLRVVVEEVSSHESLRKIMQLERDHSKSKYTPNKSACVSLRALKAASKEIRNIEIPTLIEDLLISLFIRAKKEIKLSSRRLAQVQIVLQANAWIMGRNTVDLSDLKILDMCLWQTKTDLKTIDALLSTVDAEIVKRISKHIADARNEYSVAKRGGFIRESVHKFTGLASLAATNLADSKDAGCLSADSYDDLKTQIKPLHKELKEVLEVHGHLL